MKAVIVEINGRWAAVLSDDGIVVKIRNLNYSVGQVIAMKRNLTLQKKVLVAAAAAAVFTLCGLSVWAYFTPYSYVSLDVNPSIEYTANRFDRVLSARAVNEDAVPILEGLALKHKSIRQAVAETVTQLEDNNYLTDEQTNAIMIATSAPDEGKADEIASDLEKQVEEQVSENETPVDVEAQSVGVLRVKQARELGVTPGKLNLVEKLQESAGDPENFDLQEWLSKPVKEIMKATIENKKAKNDNSAADPEQKKNKETNQNSSSDTQAQEKETNSSAASTTNGKSNNGNGKDSSANSASSDGSSSLSGATGSANNKNGSSLGNNASDQKAATGNQAENGKKNKKPANITSYTS